MQTRYTTTTTADDEQAYLRLPEEITQRGTFKATDRTGVGTTVYVVEFKVNNTG